MALFENLLRTLRPDQTLKLECGHCRHRVEWSRHEAIERLGPGATPASIRRRVCCGHCGETGDVDVWI